MRETQKYKQTEIGKIPRDWDVVKIEEIVELINGRAFKPKEWSEKGLPIVRIQNFNDLSKPFNYCNFNVLQEHIINQGDVLLAWSGTPGTSFGIHKWFGSKAVLNQHIFKVVFKSPRIGKDFFVLASNYKLNYLIAKAHGGAGLKHVTKDVVNQMQLPLPPLPEQKKIAEVLSTVDSAIQKVDEAIARTQRLKKGLMQELLTKGIGHKEFKNTEIGKIPKEWGMINISDIAEVKGGKRLPEGHQLIDSQTSYPYIRVVDFINMTINVNNLKYLLPETHEIIKQYIISVNDVYISIAGTVGIAGTIPKQLDGANLTENAAKLCNLRNVSKMFLAYMLNSSIGQHQIASYIGKATQPKLALFRIEKIKLPLPPLSEQKKIAEILSSVDEKLGLLNKRKERFINLKKGLMNELLTGKKRVKI